MLFGAKMAETSLIGPHLVGTRFGPLKLILVIIIEIKCHFLFHSSGHKLTLAEALVFTLLVFTLLVVKENFYFVSW
jgi:hypothetical protein